MQNEEVDTAPYPMAHHEEYVKLLMVGDSCVGKSALLSRFATGTFPRDLAPTIGIDFRTAHVAVGGGDPPARAKVQIWDTAGQERFRSITTSYFVGAMGLVLCYDVTDRKSFESVRYWARQAEEAQQQDGPAEGTRDFAAGVLPHPSSSPSSSGLDIVLVGNKTDLAGARSVSTEEGAALAASFSPPMKFFEASALRNQSVAPAFLAVVEDVVARLAAERAERRALRCGGEEFELVRNPGPTPVISLARAGWGSSSAAASTGSKCLATSRPDCCTIS